MTLEPSDDARWSSILHAALDTPVSAGWDLRVRQRLRERATRPHRAPRTLLSVTVSVVLVGALVAGFAITRGTAGTPRSSDPVVSALESGAGPAAPVAGGTASYVWLTSASLLYPRGCAPAGGSPPGCQATQTVRVDVIDWSGALRHQFVLPRDPAYPSSADAIVAVSPDGTRALLRDGRVIDDAGHVVTEITAMSPLLEDFAAPAGEIGDLGVTWLSDDSGVCVAGPSSWIRDPGAASKALQSGSSGGSPDGLTLEEVLLRGTVRTVASLALPAPVATADLAPPPTWGVAEATAVACDQTSDSASIAIAWQLSSDEASAGPSASSTASGAASSPTSHALLGSVIGPLSWALRLSTGAVLYERSWRGSPPDGTAWFYASGDGSLLADYRPSGSGCARLALVRLPSGSPIPVSGLPLCAGVLGIGSDSSRLLTIGSSTGGGTATVLDLLDASSGRIVRQVRLPGYFQAQAAAAPYGTEFILLIDGHLFLVDSAGGISELALAGVPLFAVNRPSGFFLVGPG
ncbi:MAG TPA: hypothetical protein VEK76_05190 [Candidatus Binatia bacterium]|nr:hypothetical protein [Candidatus Binatia bacterium]